MTRHSVTVLTGPTYQHARGACTSMHQVLLLLCDGLHCVHGTWCSTHVHPRNVLQYGQHRRNVWIWAKIDCSCVHRHAPVVHPAAPKVLGGAAFWCTPREKCQSQAGIAAPACTRHAPVLWMGRTIFGAMYIEVFDPTPPCLREHSSQGAISAQLMKFADIPFRGGAGGEK